MKQLYKFISNYQLRGIIIYLKLKFQLTTKLSVPHIKHIIFIRKHTSDIPTFFQVFGNQEYGNIPIKFKPKTIIDLGGNIGLASVFFSNKYPDSKIISVEPESLNFEMLHKNTKNYKNISILQNAVFNLDGLNVNVEDKGYGEWGFMTNITDTQLTNGIKTISINTLIKTYNISTIDILKIDIEGAEKELFESNYEAWVPLTRCIIIELHDGMKKGSSKSFFECISQYNFSFRIRGENLVLINEDIKQ